VGGAGQGAQGRGGRGRRRRRRPRVVVSGAGKPEPVKAPRAGRVAKCFAEAGEAVEYGRPLFLLEPRA
jgi:hypothetical protein